MTERNPIDIALEHHRSKRFAEAIEAYHLAIRQYPNMPELYYNLASILHERGELAAAEPLYRQATTLHPAFSQAFNNLGDVYKQLGRYEAAATALQTAIRIRPDYSEAYNNLGSLYQLQGNLEPAISAYRMAISLTPNLYYALYNLGICLSKTGSIELAIDYTRKATQLAPEFFDAQLQLGAILRSINRIDEAVPPLEKAIQLNPNSAPALLNLANAYHLQGKLVQAIPLYEHLLSMDPQHVVAHNDLASAYQEINHYDKARVHYEKAIALNPNYVNALANVAGCCFTQQDFPASVRYCREALRLNPNLHHVKLMLVNQLMIQCDWKDLEIHTDELIRANDSELDTDAISPFAFLSLSKPTTPKQQLACAKKWTSRLQARYTHQRLSRPPVSFGDRRIRIGYLSADFRKHAVAYMLPELFEKHDRTHFEIYAYALCGEDGSTIRKRIKNSVDTFREIQTFSHRQAAEQIAADKIDILVDLQGYTIHYRTEILEMRPAPIQVSYLGFPGTMGCDFIDYILVDDYVVPLDQQPYFTEKLVHLPGSYQVNDSFHEISDREFTRAECGLPERAFVFSSFNSFAKYTPSMFDVWMRLLRNVPNSVLWCAGTNKASIENLQSEAIARGVSKDRFVFAEQLPIGEHLARHRLADLFLDTFPYNGHATASIAIRTGTPIVTLSGQTLASRVAGSLLRTIGMTSLIACSFEEYEAIAMKLATDPNELRSVRSEIATKSKNSTLFDGGDFARKVERAYQEMYALLQSGAAPRPIQVKPQ